MVVHRLGLPTVVLDKKLELLHLLIPDPKSDASARSAISAHMNSHT